jgi:hypothetical protein
MLDVHLDPVAAGAVSDLPVARSGETAKTEVAARGLPGAHFTREPCSVA